MTRKNSIVTSMPRALHSKKKYTSHHTNSERLRLVAAFMYQYRELNMQVTASTRRRDHQSPRLIYTSRHSSCVSTNRWNCMRDSARRRLCRHSAASTPVAN